MHAFTSSTAVIVVLPNFFKILLTFIRVCLLLSTTI